MLHAGQPLELELDDCLRLTLGEVEAFYETGTRLLRCLRGADEFDHLVEVLEGNLEAEQ